MILRALGPFCSANRAASVHALRADVGCAVHNRYQFSATRNRESYCEGKSQLKIFEVGVIGVPTLASATEGYSEAIDHGSDGLLAATTGEWIEALEELLDSPELREHMGERARERALSQFGPEAVVRKAIQVYELPVQQRNAEHNGDVRLKITWIIPGLSIGGGGHRKIL